MSSRTITSVRALTLRPSARQSIAVNRYGHPAASTLRALASAGATVVRTDRDGSISVEPAGGELRIQNRQGQLIDSDTIKPGHESKRRDRK